MRRIVFLVFIIFILASASSFKAYSQTFQPFSFERYMAPLQMYANAYNQAVERFDRYIEYFYNSIDRGDYERALYYLKCCKDLNDRFRGELCDSKELNKLITQLEKAIEEQKKQQKQQNHNY